MASVPLMLMILSFLFYAFLVYLFYKLMFHFIIPVYKTTRRIRKGFRQMQEQMRQNAGQYQQTNATSNAGGNKAGAGEYIDFEEVN